MPFRTGSGSADHSTIMFGALNIVFPRLFSEAFRKLYGVGVEFEAFLSKRLTNTGDSFLTY
jgi:hypothetical protein